MRDSGPVSHINLSVHLSIIIHGIYEHLHFFFLNFEMIILRTNYPFDNLSLTLYRLYTAPLFSRVTAALTTPQSGSDINGMFENYVREINNMKQRK